MPPTDDDVPQLRPVLRTAEAGTVSGFDSPGSEAIAWWRRLREDFPRSGLWPLLIDDSVQARVDAGEHSRPYDEVPDGAAVFAQRAKDAIEFFRKEYADRMRAELRGEGNWTTEPVRPGFLLAARSPSVTIALVPAETSWRVPLVLALPPWNDYPDPAEHAAILRYWNEKYGAELVAMTAETAEISLIKPPRIRTEALELAWEYQLYNDGSYDRYLADDLGELAAGLLDNDVLLAWWD